MPNQGGQDPYRFYPGHFLRILLSHLPIPGLDLEVEKDKNLA